MTCALEDCECWGAWDSTCRHKAKDITPLIAWRREVWKEEVLDNLPWKDERGPSLTRWTLEPFQRQCCGNFWVYRHHLELNWTVVPAFFLWSACHYAHADTRYCMKNLPPGRTTAPCLLACRLSVLPVVGDQSSAKLLKSSALHQKHQAEAHQSPLDLQPAAHWFQPWTDDPPDRVDLSENVMKPHEKL